MVVLYIEASPSLAEQQQLDVDDPGLQDVQAGASPHLQAGQAVRIHAVHGGRDVHTIPIVRTSYFIFFQVSVFCRNFATLRVYKIIPVHNNYDAYTQ